MKSKSNFSYWVSSSVFSPIFSIISVLSHYYDHPEENSHIDSLFHLYYLYQQIFISSVEELWRTYHLGPQTLGKNHVDKYISYPLKWPNYQRFLLKRKFENWPIFFLSKTETWEQVSTWKLKRQTLKTVRHWWERLKQTCRNKVPMFKSWKDCYYCYC